MNVPKCIEELKDELLKFLPDDLNFKNTVIFITGSEFHSYGEDIETIIKADKLDAKFFTFFMGNSPSDVESWKTSNDIPNQIIVSKMVCEIPKFIETLDLLTLVCPPPRCIGKNHESLSLQLEFKKKREGVIFEVLYRQKDDKNDLLRTFNTTTFILDGLQPETEYSIRVRLIDKNKKKSPFTSPLTQKTLRSNLSTRY